MRSEVATNPSPPSRGTSVAGRAASTLVHTTVLGAFVTWKTGSPCPSPGIERVLMVVDLKHGTSFPTSLSAHGISGVISTGALAGSSMVAPSLKVVGFCACMAAAMVTESSSGTFSAAPGSSGT